MPSPVSFNVMSEEGALLCPVCGFPGYSEVPAYTDNTGRIGTTICPCCLWEPGFDDNPLASAKAKATIRESILAYRTGWVTTKEWRGQRGLKPDEFDGSKQLDAMLKRAPDLR
jgi:hypothetical protein